jgi:hypothetical protein
MDERGMRLFLRVVNVRCENEPVKYMSNRIEMTSQPQARRSPVSWIVCGRSVHLYYQDGKGSDRETVSPRHTNSSRSPSHAHTTAKRRNISDQPQVPAEQCLLLDMVVNRSGKKVPEGFTELQARATADIRGQHKHKQPEPLAVSAWPSREIRLLARGD